MLISNSIFLFLDPTRVVLQDLQFKIIFIYFILAYFTALWVSQYLKQAALAPFFPLSLSQFSSYMLALPKISFEKVVVGLLCSQPAVCLTQLVHFNQ